MEMNLLTFKSHKTPYNILLCPWYMVMQFTLLSKERIPSSHLPDAMFLKAILHSSKLLI